MSDEKVIDPIEGPSLPGVLVTRVPINDGTERLEITSVNGLDILAIPSMLELAARIARQNIGLS